MKKVHKTMKSYKKTFGPQSTKKIIAGVQKSITNRHLRKDMVSFIRAADGKKIRNTSGI